MLVSIVLLFALAVTHQSAYASPRAECPAAAAANAYFVVADGDGRPVEAANILFTASNWDSTISELTDARGSATVFCVPAGSGYDVTVSKKGFTSISLTVDVRTDNAPHRVTLPPSPRRPGRYVLVTSGGVEIPGVAVRIQDSDATIQNYQTDINGEVMFAQLTGAGAAIVENWQGLLVSEPRWSTSSRMARSCSTLCPRTASP